MRKLLFKIGPFKLSYNYFLIRIVLVFVLLPGTVSDILSVYTSVSDSESKDLWANIAPYFSPPSEFTGKYGEYRSPLKFYNGQTVTTTKEWKKRREEILERWNEMMGKWPPFIEKQKMEILQTQQKEGYLLYKIRFNWLPGQKTEGYLLIPDIKGKKPAVITVFYEPETSIGIGNSKFCDFAVQLAKRGFVTLSIGTSETTNSKTYSPLPNAG